MIHARNYGQAEEEKATIDLTEEEKEMELKLIVSEEKSQVYSIYMHVIVSGPLNYDNEGTVLADGFNNPLLNRDGGRN